MKSKIVSRELPKLRRNNTKVLLWKHWDGNVLLLVQGNSKAGVVIYSETTHWVLGETYHISWQTQGEFLSEFYGTVELSTTQENL